MTIGKIFYNLYHKPIGFVSRTLKTGLRRTVHINAGRNQMMVAAETLKEVTCQQASTYHVYFLTGKKYWFQTAFCIYSLQQQAGVAINAVLVDDGSFDDALEAKIKSQFPTTVTVVRVSHINQLLDEKMPQSYFPVLRQRRLVYPHIRKLTDIHILPGEGAKLVLDSDMLFFHKPVEILNWLQNPDGFLFMRDTVESYGYSRGLMKELTGGAELPNRLNVGVAGIATHKIDWQQLENWTQEMLKKEGSSYLQEQALSAMIAATKPHTFLTESAYKVLPSIKSDTITEVLHHYVAEAKYDYFVKGWKRVLYA